MHVGEKIKKLREQTIVDGKKLSLRKLAEMAHISAPFLSDIERGAREPSLDTLRKIAAALNVPPGELLDINEGTPLDQMKMYDDIIFVPLLSDATVACCGDGFSYEYAEEVIEKMIPIIIDRDGVKTNRMFAIRASGDSMEDAGINDGDIVLIAPEEEAYNGSTVFVCYGPQKRSLIRWWYLRANGDIVLKAANPSYPDIVVTKEDIEMGWFVFVGRVVQVMSNPRDGI